MPAGALLAIVAAGCTVTGCGGSASSPPTTRIPPAVSVASPESCPDHPPATLTAPSTTVPARPGVSTELVPPGPVSAVICRYSGVNATGGTALVRTVAVPGPLVGMWVSLLDSPRWTVVTSPSTYNCPEWDGALDLLVFSYASGPDVAVTVDLGGCRFASNGTRTVQGDAIATALTPVIGSAGTA